MEHIILGRLRDKILVFTITYYLDILLVNN